MNKANDSVGAHAVAGISILVSPDITGPANSPIGSSAGIQTGSSQPSTSKDPAKQSQGTSSQKNSLSTSLSGHAESDSNKVSPENGSRQGKEMHSLTNSSSTSSAGTDTASTPTASRDDLPSDDDSSTGFLQSNARKRRLESQEDDGKPAAQRSRLGDVTAAPQCDGPVDSNEDTRPNPIDVKEENDSSLQSPVVNLSRCGYCETCTESYVCGKCSRCSFKIPCVFSPCYNYGIHDSTLHHYKQQANSVKVADAQFEGQFEKIYGENGVISKTNLQRERMSPAVKSTTTKGRHGQWPGSLCGTCSSCTDPVICGKCSSCLGRRDGRCAFAPCLAYDYKASTLSTFIKNAKSVTKGDKPLEDKFEELYGDDGVFATKLKDVDRSESDEPPSKWQRAGGHCGNCSSCTSPMACGKCIACLGHRKGRCVFALCLAYNYAETTLAKSREQAKSAKVGNMRLEQQFEHLYGPGGVFASKVNSKNEPKVLHDKKVRSRCGTCLSCTAMLRCKKCQACLGKRNGACVFHPCLTYEYKESTLNLYRQQAQSVKGGDKCLEDQFERIYGEQGLIAQKDNLINTFSPSKVPAVAKASSSLRSYIHNCQNCSSCCSPITCGICVRCRKGTKCVFSICQNFAYKDTRMVMYEKWARQACEMCTDKKLKVRFDEIFSKGTTKAEAKRQAATYQRAQSVKAGEKRLEDQFERIYGTEGLITAQKDKSINTSSRLKVHEEAKASPRPRSFRCHNCSSCCSPITCLICTRCHKGTKCIFSICQNYAYKDSRMTIYETWARKALEICKDKKLKVRYEEIFGKSTTKVNTKRKADTDQPPIGTRIYGEWPGNNVSVVFWERMAVVLLLDLTFAVSAMVLWKDYLPEA